MKLINNRYKISRKGSLVPALFALNIFAFFSLHHPNIYLSHFKYNFWEFQATRRDLLYLLKKFII